MLPVLVGFCLDMIGQVKGRVRLTIGAQHRNTFTPTPFIVLPLIIFRVKVKNTVQIRAALNHDNNNVMQLNLQLTVLEARRTYVNPEQGPSIQI